MTALLTATDVVKSYSQGETSTPVLQGISLEIEPGEFVAIMGPSGSGKSTLLYCLSGVDAVDSGSVTLHDTDITRLSEDDRAVSRGKHMGFVFQDPNLLDSLNVMDNILLAASLQRIAEPETLRQRSLALMHRTGIDGLEGRGVSEISGGQRQRVSLCRALIHEPDLLIGDEPTGALNSAASAEVIGLLHAFNQDGMTMLIVTHDPRIASHASRVLFLSDGRVVDELRFAREMTNGNREREVLNAMERLGI